MLDGREREWERDLFGSKDLFHVHKYEVIVLKKDVIAIKLVIAPKCVIQQI